MKIYWVSCGHNSSYSFPLIVLKLARCFLHGMKMCMWFGYNPLIIFFSLFLLCERYEMLSKCIDSGYLVGAAPLTIFHQLFWNIADVFSMEWRHTCGFGIILQLFFSLFLLCELSLFLVWNAIKVYKQWVPCGRNSLQFSFNCFENLQMFSAWNEDVGGAGQKIPWTKAPMPFFAWWINDPTLLRQGGQNIPHWFDGMDKRSHTDFSPWTKHPIFVNLDRRPHFLQKSHRSAYKYLTILFLVFYFVTNNLILVFNSYLSL